MGDKVLGVLGDLLAGQQHVVDQSESVVEQLRDDAAQQGGADFERGIVIDLAQPRLALLVDQIVQSPQLKTHPLARPHQPLTGDCLADVPTDTFDVRKGVL